MLATFDMRHLDGPFDIVGDVHGCADELEHLLARLGHGVVWRTDGGARVADVSIVPGRRLVFVGDLVDRGPRAPDSLRIVMAALRTGYGHCVPGNHDDKFRRWLRGNDVTLTHGLDVTVSQMRTETDAFHNEARDLIERLPPYVWLDGGRLVVAHAGIEAPMIGHTSDRIRHFCLFGDTDGKTDAHGLAIRYDWAARYDGNPRIVYGHTPVAEPAEKNNSVCIDTGCCFGGALTALRYPEMQYVTVPARAKYASRARPFGLPPPRP